MAGKISLEDVKKLREVSGAGMQDAQKALLETDGDVDKALEFLRKKGEVRAAKRSGRTAGQGLVEAYVHGGKVGVLVEVNCETDFVAKTDDFKNFVHDLALQIVAADPTCVSREQVDANILEKEKEIFKEQVDGKKPEAVVNKIIEGKLEKFYQDVCLLD